MSDPVLLSGYDSGNHQLFTSLVEEHRPYILAALYRATRDVALSEDLAQETFTAAWQGLSQLRASDKVRPWLCGIARNLAKNLARRRYHDPVYGASELDDSGNFPSLAASPRTIVALREEQGILWNVVKDLTPTYGEPLLRFYQKQESIETIASALQVSVVVVRQRLARGRTQLRSRLEGVGP